MRKWKLAFLFFLTQIINYGLLVINFRAVAQADYAWSAVTDFAIASFNFLLIKKIAKEEDSFHLWLGYAFGGLVGSIIGIRISVSILGK